MQRIQQLNLPAKIFSRWCCAMLVLFCPSDLKFCIIEIQVPT
ncbi:hypothetical protein [Acinetobacter indicus]